MRKMLSAEKCTGCAACANVCPRHCISMSEDEEGFRIPAVDDCQCVDCGRCAEVCPVLTPDGGVAPQRVLAAWASDLSMRRTGSSGGVFQALARCVVESGGLVNGVRFDANGELGHSLSGDVDDIAVFGGSKYVQSDVRMIYSEVGEALGRGRRVLFVSVPCQIDALYHFLGGRQDRLVTCDLICHGVPSPGYLRKVLDEAGVPVGDYASVSFRNPSLWGDFGLRHRGRDLGCGAKLYLDAFMGGMNLRNSCYNCPYARRERIGDLTLGDFWGIGKWRKFKGSRRDGVSLVLVNSQKGQRLLEEAAGHVVCEERSWREASRVNLQLLRPMSRPTRRNEFYRKVKSSNASEVYNWCGLGGAPAWKKALLLPRRAAGAVIRWFVRLTGIID